MQNLIDLGLVDSDQPVSKYPGAKCSECPLFDQAFVPPWNIENGEILFVGEAPGTQEVLEGIPFVGQSGQLLDKVIERVGRDPLKIAKTNACLCRPHRQSDGSVTPPLEALQACQGALETALAAFPGRIVVTLGAASTAALDEHSDDDHEGGILARRGVWCRAAIETPVDPNEPEPLSPFGYIRVLHYMPTLHPAFVLRSPGYVQKLIDDISTAYQGPEKKHKFLSTPFQIVEDFETLKSMIVELRSAPVVSFDIETEYLQWYDTPTKRGANVLCLVFAGSIDKAYIVPDSTLTQPRVLEFLQMFFDERAVLAHNGKFDVTVCEAKLGLNIRLIDDTLLMHYTSNEGKGGHGLKELASETFQLEDYEESILAPIFKQHKMNRDNRNYGIIPRDILYRYASIDAVVTLALYDVLKSRVEADEQFDWPYRNVLVNASNALGVVELNGIPIDRPYLQKVLKLVENEVDKLTEKLRAIVLLEAVDDVKHDGWIKAIMKISEMGINPNSSMQISYALYEVFGLQLHKQPIKVTSTNTGKECIAILLERYPTHEFLLTLQEFRRVEKIRSTYVSKLLEIADKDDLVHVNYLLHGTETGRLSAGDSLHGIPRPEKESTPELKRYGAMIRGAFIAPPGFKMIIADYSQAELRCFADETQEPFLLRAYNDGLDVHAETMKIMCRAMKIDFATLDEHSAHYKEIRTLAKNINFGGLLYLGGSDAIAGMTGLNRDLVKEVMDYYYSNLSVARQWQKDQFRFAKKHGYVKNRFGRKRRFILQVYSNIDEIRKASVNAVIQGDASDLTLLSVCEMVERGIKVVHTVHDSIIAIAHESQAESIAAQMKEIMERIGCKWFPRVPWQADIEIGDRWFENRPNLDEV